MKLQNKIIFFTLSALLFWPILHGHKNLNSAKRGQFHKKHKQNIETATNKQAKAIEAKKEKACIADFKAAQREHNAKIKKQEKANALQTRNTQKREQLAIKDARKQEQQSIAFAKKQKLAEIKEAKLQQKANNIAARIQEKADQNNAKKLKWQHLKRAQLLKQAEAKKEREFQQVCKIEAQQQAKLQAQKAAKAKKFIQQNVKLKAAAYKKTKAVEAKEEKIRIADLKAAQREYNAKIKKQEKEEAVQARSAQKRKQIAIKDAHKQEQQSIAFAKKQEQTEIKKAKLQQKASDITARIQEKTDRKKEFVHECAERKELNRLKLINKKRKKKIKVIAQKRAKANAIALQTQSKLKRLADKKQAAVNVQLEKIRFADYKSKKHQNDLKCRQEKKEAALQDRSNLLRKQRKAKEAHKQKILLDHIAKKQEQAAIRSEKAAKFTNKKREQFALQKDRKEKQKAIFDAREREKTAMKKAKIQQQIETQYAKISKRLEARNIHALKQSEEKRANAIKAEHLKHAKAQKQEEIKTNKLEALEAKITKRSNQKINNKQQHQNKLKILAKIKAEKQLKQEQVKRKATFIKAEKRDKKENALNEKKELTIKRKQQKEAKRLCLIADKNHKRARIMAQKEIKTLEAQQNKQTIKELKATEKERLNNELIAKQQSKKIGQQLKAKERKANKLSLINKKLELAQAKKAEAICKLDQKNKACQQIKEFKIVQKQNIVNENNHKKIKAANDKEVKAKQLTLKIEQQKQIAAAKQEKAQLQRKIQEQLAKEKAQQFEQSLKLKQRQKDAAARAHKHEKFAKIAHQKELKEEKAKVIAAKLFDLKAIKRANANKKASVKKEKAQKRIEIKNAKLRQQENARKISKHKKAIIKAASIAQHYQHKLKIKRQHDKKIEEFTQAQAEKQQQQQLKAEQAARKKKQLAYNFAEQKQQRLSKHIDEKRQKVAKKLEQQANKQKVIALFLQKKLTAMANKQAKATLAKEEKARIAELKAAQHEHNTKIKEQEKKEALQARSAQKRKEIAIKDARKQEQQSIAFAKKQEQAVIKEAKAMQKANDIAARIQEKTDQKSAKKLKQQNLKRAQLIKKAEAKKEREFQHACKVEAQKQAKLQAQKAANSKKITQQNIRLNAAIDKKAKTIEAKEEKIRIAELKAAQREYNAKIKKQEKEEALQARKQERQSIAFIKKQEQAEIKKAKVQQKAKNIAARMQQKADQNNAKKLKQQNLKRAQLLKKAKDIATRIEEKARIANLKAIQHENDAKIKKQKKIADKAHKEKLARKRAEQKEIKHETIVKRKEAISAQHEEHRRKLNQAAQIRHEKAVSKRTLYYELRQKRDDIKHTQRLARIDEIKNSITRNNNFLDSKEQEILTQEAEGNYASLLSSLESLTFIGAGHNLALLNSNQSFDKSAFVQTIINTPMTLTIPQNAWGRIDFNCTPRIDTFWGSSDLHKTSKEYLKIGRAVTESKHSFSIERPMVWLRETWLKLYSRSEETSLQIGFFPKQIGLGLILGDNYKESNPLMLSTEMFQIDQFRPGAQLITHLGDKKYKLTCYYSLYENNATSFDKKIEFTQAQELKNCGCGAPYEKAIPHRPLFQASHIVSAEVNLPVETNDSFCFDITPCMVYNHEDNQTVEFFGDANSRLLILGSSLSLKTNRFTCLIDVAGNLGHQEVKAWDRNITEMHANMTLTHLFVKEWADQDNPNLAVYDLLNTSGTYILSPTFPYPPGIDISLNYNGGTPFKAKDPSLIIYDYLAPPTSAGDPVDLNFAFKNSYSRFRKCYKNKYRALMVAADCCYDISDRYKVGGILGFASGDDNPNDTQEKAYLYRLRPDWSQASNDHHKIYQGFTGIQSMYTGKFVRSMHLLRAHKMNTPLSQVPELTTNLFTNLAYGGVGLWFQKEYLTGTLRCNGNAIAIGQSHSLTYGLDPVMQDIYETYNFQEDAATKKRFKAYDKRLNTALGIELNGFVEFFAKSNLTFYGMVSVFVPGSHYHDIVRYSDLQEGKRIPLKNQRIAFTKDISGFENAERMSFTLADNIAISMHAGINLEFDTFSLHHHIFKNHKNNTITPFNTKSPGKAGK